MKVFVAGATGAIGKRLVPLLVGAGHSVFATTRTPGKRGMLEAAGARALVLDALDRDAVMRAVAAAQPDVVVHQMTAIPDAVNPMKLDAQFALTNRLRTEAAAHLLDAARAAGAAKLVAQSYAGFPNLRKGGPVTTEDDPFVANPPAAVRETIEAIRILEWLVTTAGGITGIVLRYGSFYGAGTSLAREGRMTEMIRKRKVPTVGRGEGVWSFIHIDDAAAATLAAIERGAAGIYNIVDDEPASIREWLPEAARILGARAPRRLPAWIARLVVGEGGVRMMEEARGASNAKAKRALGWQPRYGSWREGFRREVA
ncbi:MAG TPA: NAD(P)-dependent oxidoreductase [Thermoanaerobaculia bacterium]|nr:NAD(P)-dependent oxidoreductase [Thermoanaerobaculia bacterium]